MYKRPKTAASKRRCVLQLGSVQATLASAGYSVPEPNPKLTCNPQPGGERLQMTGSSSEGHLASKVNKDRVNKEAGSTECAGEGESCSPGWGWMSLLPFISPKVSCNRGPSLALTHTVQPRLLAGPETLAPELRTPILSSPELIASVRLSLCSGE